MIVALHAYGLLAICVGFFWAVGRNAYRYKSSIDVGIDAVLIVSAAILLGRAVYLLWSV